MLNFKNTRYYWVYKTRLLLYLFIKIFKNLFALKITAPTLNKGKKFKIETNPS